MAFAQSAWPKIQSDMYPFVADMQLVRHEQSILLGEGTQQTGLFFASIKNTFSEKLQKELVADAAIKGWQLHSFVRYGTSYVISLTQDGRILDIRLTNHPSGVEAVYSVVLNQAASAKPASVAQAAPGIVIQMGSAPTQVANTAADAPPSLIDLAKPVAR